MTDLSRRQEPPGADMVDHNRWNKNAIVRPGLLKKSRHYAIDSPIVLGGPDVTAPGLRVVIDAVPIGLSEHTVGANGRGKLFIDLPVGGDRHLNTRAFVDLGHGVHILEPVPDVVA